MSEAETPEVENIDTMSNGVVVTFTDGRCAYFDGHLLYSVLERAQQIVETDETQWPPPALSVGGSSSDSHSDDLISNCWDLRQTNDRR